MTAELFSFLLQGAIIGFSIAAPVGPIGILCIQRSLKQDPIHGFVSGLGAATADALYGLVAGLGLTVISRWLVGGSFYLNLLGGLFLCYLAWHIMSQKPSRKDSSDGEKGSLGISYLSTFLLTLANPMTIFLFVGIIAGLPPVLSTDATFVSMFVLGVFLGSASWWLILSQLVTHVKELMTNRHLSWLNRVSGLILLSFGIAAILRSLGR